MSNNPQSEYALHSHHSKHEYGPMIIMSLLHPAHKGQQTTSFENFYSKLFQRYNTIINEQSQKVFYFDRGHPIALIIELN